jgi:Fe-S-cluster containining protein
MAAIAVGPGEQLPLTCTRLGTCCHGKLVWINPWEAARLARALGVSLAQFAQRDLCDGGIRLRFEGAHRWRDQPACALYRDGAGCAAHAARPLACRLYPLGRTRVGERVSYGYDGPVFPCRVGCPGVDQLPTLTVGEYLASQDVADGEAVADAYVELVQDLAEGAFVIVVDSGLAASGRGGVQESWRRVALMSHASRVETLGAGLAKALLEPSLDPADGRAFVAAHARLLQEFAQRAFASLRTADELAAASARMLAAALHLAASLNADRAVLMERWLATASSAGIR